MANNPLDADAIVGPEKAGKEGAPLPKSVPKGDLFQSFLGEGTMATQRGAISPMELASGGRPSLGTPTLTTVLSQVHDTQSTLNDVKSKLQTPNLQLQRSQEQLLGDKLATTTDHIRQASTIVGGNILALPQMPKTPSAIEKFVNYVNHGQNQLLEVKKQLEELNGKDESLKPGELLLMQVNLSQAQQSIEYSSVLITRAVEVIKQTINIQL